MPPNKPAWKIVSGTNFTWNSNFEKSTTFGHAQTPALSSVKFVSWILCSVLFPRTPLNQTHVSVVRRRFSVQLATETCCLFQKFHDCTLLSLFVRVANSITRNVQAYVCLTASRISTKSSSTEKRIRTRVSSLLHFHAFISKILWKYDTSAHTDSPFVRSPFYHHHYRHWSHVEVDTYACCPYDYSYFFDSHNSEGRW